MSNYLNKSKRYKGFHYSVLEPEMLEYLHNQTLVMMKEVLNIFHSNNIQYMICGGTLLGAVTTQKFIPWDDDVDICVLEDDYDRMIVLLSENLPSWMALQWTTTEEKYFHGWVKVRDKNSHVYPDIESYKYNGVWIDLYKCALVDKKDVNYLIAKEHFDYLNRRYTVGDISIDEMNKRICENGLVDKIKNAEFEAVNNSHDKSKTYIIWSASKITLDENVCLPRKKYVFEDQVVYGFNNADKYLTNHYDANYSTLPDDELRRVGINKIDILL